MTNNPSENKPKLINRLALPIFIGFFVLLAVYSREYKEAIIGGIKISCLTVIPAVFPFFVLADLLQTYSCGAKKDSKICKILNISATSRTSVLIGLTCGFPLGVKCITELYAKKSISKDEYERLCLYLNNPSAAFVISGVGMGLLGSIKIGILLYLSVILSALLIGFYLGTKSKEIHNAGEISRQSFDFATSIKNAGLSSMYLSSFIIFFSCINGIFKKIIKGSLFLCLFAVFSEIGNSVVLIGSNIAFSLYQKFTLLSFALGFSGFSVIMQSFALLPKEISRKRIILYKFIQGMLCTAISTLLFVFI